MPILRNTTTVRKDFNAQAVWRWSRRNLAKLPSAQYESLQQKVTQIAPERNITRIIASQQFLSRVQAGKVDLTKLTDTDLRACVKPRTLFKGDALDLRLVNRVKRGPIQVISNIVGSLLLLKFPRLARKKYDYAFMVHPRDYKDVLRGVPFLKYIPERLGRALVKKLPPFKLSEIEGLTDVEGKPVKGALMTVGWDREMFESDFRGREEKISDLVVLARRMGIKYVGFAALLPWASRYGKCAEGTIAQHEILNILKDSRTTWKELKDCFFNPDETALRPRTLKLVEATVRSLVKERLVRNKLIQILRWAAAVREETHDVTITTGHPFTVAIITSNLKEILRLHPKKDPLIAIVGAGGSTGSSCCRKFAQEGINNFLLLDRVKKTGVVGLDSLQAEMTAFNPAAKIRTSTDLADLIEADVTIVVSSARGTIVKSEFLKPGAIVIDDSQPRNVDPKIAEQRNDIMILTVLAQIQGVIPNFVFDKHTPLTGASFTCLGDVALRARTQTRVNATGPADLAGVKVVEEMVDEVKTKQHRDPLAPGFFTYNRKQFTPEEVRQIAALSLQDAE